MIPAIVYLACLIGAIGLYLLLAKGSRPLRAVGVILGLGAFAWILVEAGRFIGAAPDEPTPRPSTFFVIFSLIAVASAVRMITHTRPVYSALYFVMVVLSSAGLFLLLEAEFMAFALIIVYAGAILITYMFVLMLAQQAPTEGTGADGRETDYDRIPREPGMATTVGFILLALFTNMIFGGMDRLAPSMTPVEADAAVWKKLEILPGYARTVIDRAEPGAVPGPDPTVSVEDDVAWVNVIRPGETLPTSLRLPPDARPTNIQLVGLDLVTRFPVSLELAGIILLLAMFGAVVLARKQIELGEDEIREAAGMRKLALHSDDDRHGDEIAEVKR